MSLDLSHILTKGLEASLASTPIVDGTLRFTTDANRLYLDYKNGSNQLVRVRISDTDDTYTEAQLEGITNPLPKIYITSDTHRAFVNVSGTWYDLAALRLIEDNTTDEDLPLWFSDITDDHGRYNTGVTYNPVEDTVKLNNLKINESMVFGNLVITDNISEDDETVEFSFAAEDGFSSFNVDYGDLDE